MAKGRATNVIMTTTGLKFQGAFLWALGANRADSGDVLIDECRPAVSQYLDNSG
jgi:hypothetical protein